MGGEAARQGKRAPDLTGDPRTDGALLALARLLLDIAAGATDPAGEEADARGRASPPVPVDDAIEESAG